MKVFRALGGVGVFIDPGIGKCWGRPASWVIGAQDGQEILSKSKVQAKVPTKNLTLIDTVGIRISGI